VRSESEIDAAVELVWQGLAHGAVDGDRLVGKLDLHDGLRVQLGVLGRYLTRGEKLAGWKVGMTSGPARDAMGVGFRPFGFVLQSRTFASGARIPQRGIAGCGIETELCFHIGSTLGGVDTTPEQAAAAVAGVSPAFEINSRRITGGSDEGVRLADDLSQWGIVVGPELAPVPEDFDFEGLRVELWNGERLAGSALGRDEIDPHYLSLARLAKLLARFGLALQAGQRVITGAYARQPVRGPGAWRGTFGMLGSVEVEFA
jgi:2-keto-4-pentenoate hydratase